MASPAPTEARTEPPVTVVLPVRNGGRYIRQTVASLIAQADPDWRLIVLDNHSDDDTRDIVRDFADPRIELMESDTALDIYHSWHRGLGVAERLTAENPLMTPLMTFVGHDDWFYPNFVAETKALARAHPEATLYQLLLDLVDAEGREIRPGKPMPERETWLDMTAGLGWNFRDSVGTGYVFRAADYVRVGGMPHLPRILYADHLLFIRLTALGYKAANMQRACAYRLHSGSTSSHMSAPKINDQTEAFAGFVEGYLADFPQVRDTDLGRLALQTWIGRELYLFDTPAVLRTLTPENQARVATLRQHVINLGGEARMDHWSYQSHRRLHRTLRHVKLHARFALARLRARRHRQR